MDIAVIGGSGFLGTHLIRELLSRGQTVRLIKHIGSKDFQGKSRSLEQGAFSTDAAIDAAGSSAPQQSVLTSSQITGTGNSGTAQHSEEQQRTVNRGSLQVLQISLDDQAALMSALKGCHSVAYLSGINREPQAGDFQLIHVTRLQNVITAIKNLSADSPAPSPASSKTASEDAPRENTTKIIYTSFLKARPSRYSQYLQSKYDGEILLHHCGLDYTIFKPGICFGKGDQMIKSIAMGLKLLPFFAVFGAVGIRESAMRPLSAKDMAVMAACALIENRMSRQTIAVVGPEEITLSTAARRVASVLKKKLLIVHFPLPLMYTLAWTLEKLSANALVTVSQVRMLADGLSSGENAPDPMPADLLPKTYFREEEIQEALGLDQLK